MIASIKSVLGYLVVLGGMACHGVEDPTLSAEGMDQRTTDALRASVPGDWTCEAFFPGQGARYGAGRSRAQAEAAALKNCNREFMDGNLPCMIRQCSDFAIPASAPGAEPQFPPYVVGRSPNPETGLGYRCKVDSQEITGVPSRTFTAIRPTKEQASAAVLRACHLNNAYCEDQTVGCLPVVGAP